MSQEQVSRGIEMIESAAEKTGLRLGSRAVDLFRGTVRLSFEKEAQTGSRTRLRAPTFEFIREFVEDLPAQEEYHLAVVDFLESLSLRLIQTNAQEFLTLLVVPLTLEIHWPFRSEQSSDDEFIHVLGEGRDAVGEANFTVGCRQSTKGR